MSNPFETTGLADQIVHIEELAPRESVFGEIRQRMHPALREHLVKSGIDRLYNHQAQSYDALMQGRDVVVATGTNSGKTLCYNLAAAQMCLSEPSCHCLYLFPTKALAQDQLRRLEDSIPDASARVATYDGDTPVSQRGAIRKLANIVVTNPDMLHVGILPSVDLWAKFLKSLRLIVLDEMHVYRGVFGSHMGAVVRRLLRLCEGYRARPRIVGCSATIGNPAELFTALTGRTPELIQGDGAPSGKRTFVLYNPPEIGAGRRLSSNVATSEVVSTLAEAGQRTLAFNRSRVAAELVLRYTRKRLGHPLDAMVESYRSGYTPKERRAIEKALFDGRLIALSATNAMELGVDVGSLDAVVMNGYPGTISSFWQQAGRAGRGEKDGLAVFVAGSDPLDQFLLRRPATLFDARNEMVTANPENPAILDQHLVCAVYERPMAMSEVEQFGPTALERLEDLDRRGELQFRSGMFFYPSFEAPAPKVDIRGSGDEQVALCVGADTIGTMDRWRAMTSAHDGAVYLHRGATFLVERLDLEQSRAEMIAAEPDYYTTSIVQSLIETRLDLETTRVGAVDVRLCALRVTDTVQGYRRRAIDGDAVLSHELLELPPTTYGSIGVRFDLPELDLQGDLVGQIGAIHGVEHALVAVGPLFAGCDRLDLGSAWFVAAPDTMRPCVTIYDKTPGGVGLAEALYAKRKEWVRAAYDLVHLCPCEDGCPGCLLSARCEAGNESLAKRATVNSLRRML